MPIGVKGNFCDYNAVVSLIGGEGVSEKEERGKECEHEWKQVGTKHGGSILELTCIRCGAKKEIELFP